MKIIITICIALLSYICYPTIETTIRNSIKQYYLPVENKYYNIEWNSKNNYVDNLHNKQSDKPSDKPNVLLIIADDFGYNDAKNLKNIKSIYENGANFINAYAGHATCAPSRASLLTGKFATKIGFEFTPHPATLDMLMFFQNNVIRKNKLNIKNLLNTPSMEYLSLNKNETLISDVLKKHNYKNYYIGKWHLGETNNYRPLERGYDESLTFLYGASMYALEGDKNIVNAEITKSLYDTYMTKWIPFGISYNNNKMFKPNKYMTDYLSDNVVNIIKTHNYENPFFITLAYNAPHNPYQALKSDYNLEKNTTNHNEKVYNAMLKSLDRGVGNILQTLKNINKYNNTLIIFTSDNGGTHLIELNNINYPYNGWKCSFFEGGIKVPLYIQWIDKIPSNIIYDKTVSHVDIFTTITSLVNYTDDNTDGVNLLSYIEKNNTKNPHEILFWRSADYKALKVNNWKLSIASDMNKSWFVNLQDDVKEENNLIKHIYQNKSLEYEYNKMYNLLYEINKKQKPPLWKSSIKTAIPLYDSVIKSLNDEYVYWSV